VTKKYWYRTRSHGSLSFTYPICWQGWAFLLAIVVAFVAGAAILRSPVIFVPVVVAALFALGKTDSGFGDPD